MPMSTKRKAPGKLAAPYVKSGVKQTKATIDESRTSVAGTDGLLKNPAYETIEISSGPDSDEDLSDADEPEAETEPTTTSTTTNGQKADAGDEAGSDEEDDETTSPSFGELLRGTETIDVPALLQQSSTGSNALSRPTQLNIAPPSGQTLITVLTQALKTDDTDLLESCLVTKDLDSIRGTIERIDSALAGTLLNKLASRLYRRPGRAGALMTWIQWTLVAHGGAIASQPKVLQGLNGLQKVLAERSKGLNSLLALKGKLDMLESQMDLRRRMQRRASTTQRAESDDDEDDENVIWVEGETDGKRRGGDDDDDDLAPMANGFIGESDDEEDDEDENEYDDDEDVEDVLDEDEVIHDDKDDSMAEDDESDAEPAPPAKLQKTSKAFSKRK